MQAAAPDLVLLDLRLPDGNGLDFLAELAALGEDRPQALVLTAYGEIGDAVQAIKLGAADYLKKPIDLDELRLVVERVLASTQMRHQLDYSRERDSHVAVEGALLIGESPPIQRLREQIHRLARLGGGTGEPAPTVLILGETGSGKDVAARLLHLAGPVREQPFVQVDCASLPRDLIEAELFGHEKGAFTGAVQRRIGRFEQADGGTLFLDEIGEIDASIQVKLLRALSERTIERVGSNTPVKVDVRVVAATNKNLASLVAKGDFREDLFFRLNVVRIEMPALRERAEDIVLLAGTFLREFAEENGRPVKPLSDAALRAMRAYPWPGNVRELRTAIEHGVVMSNDPLIDLHHLPASLFGAPPAIAPSATLPADGKIPLAAPREFNLHELETSAIRAALAEAAGNRTRAAELLGISRRTLQRKLKEDGA
jgi:DNA-binding NtrC family response regulator